MKYDLWAPPEYWLLSNVERLCICNGCGSSQAKFDFIPDTMYLLNISEACDIHDYMYHVGITEEDKMEADRRFLSNLLRIINTAGGFLRWFRRRRALKYYEAVVELGGPAFWEGKEGG